MKAKKEKTLDRAAKAEEIRNRHQKISRIEDTISRNKDLLKEEKKKLKSDIKALVNSYPSQKKGKKAVKKIIKTESKDARSLS